MEEIWKPVLDYEDFYEVSTRGNVRSLSRTTKYSSSNQVGNFSCTRPKKGKLLSLVNRGRGYICVSLYKDKKPKLINVHILVAEAFLGKRQKGLYVNHKDGDKSNNNIENLEWVTASKNHKHAVNTLGKLRGDTHGMAKLSEEDVLKIKELLSLGQSSESISEDYPVCASTIRKIKAKTTWKYLKDK